jgi:hypothetical protein
MLNQSPLASSAVGMNLDGSADLDKDMDSTDFSQQSNNRKQSNSSLSTFERQSTDISA